MLPPFIAFVGHPESGKSTAAEIVKEVYGGTIVDDGLPLRRFAVEELGLSWDDVLTQAGKRRHTSILDKDWEHRKILGEFGKALEDLFGDQIMAFMAASRHRPGSVSLIPSCRKNQGAYYRALGGMVIQIDNPLAGPSENDFDVWNKNEVDAVIINDALAEGMLPEVARHDLRMKLIAALNDHLLKRGAVAA